MTAYATPVPHDVVKQSGTLSRFPTAIHRDHILCLDAAYKIRDEFVSEVEVELNAKTIGDYPILGLVHVVAFTIPECLPERLALMTRFTDFTIMNDDYYDAVDVKEVTAFNAELQRSLQGPNNSNTSTSEGTNLSIKTKQFQASILVEMMTMDRDLAMDVLTTYSNGLEVATFPPSNIASIEEYLPIRLMNCGLDVFQDMSCFGLGIHLTPAEKAKLSEIANTALYTAALINDCHSWPKEIKHHLETPGSDIPFNAVCILMRQYNCSDTEAIQKLREKYVEIQERHLDLVRQLEKAEGVISDSHRKYIMAAQYAASGSEFWSIYAPRYPTKEDLGQPECVLVDGVFHWKHEWTNGNSLNKSAILDGGAVEMNGVKRSQTNEDVAPGTKRAKIPNGHVDGVKKANGVNGTNGVKGANGVKHTENGHTDSTNGSCNGTQHVFQKPSEDTVRAPYNYIKSLPSKKVRDTFIEALDSWLHAPPTSLTAVKNIVGMLHHSSLMLDDIEDDSLLRRGHPTSHTLFGTAQTINSANFVFVCAFEELQNLRGAETAMTFLEELKHLHCGQAMDLHWKYHTHLPSVDEYMMMVDNKTGGLFRLCVRLMQGESSVKSEHIDSGRFVTLLGRYFQIRDDYQNLMSEEYASQKGFCEDLDEGKISLPLIYCLTGSSPEQIMIRGIMQHKGEGEMPMELKKLILGEMKKTGALNSTLSLLQEMQEEILKELRLLEAEFGSKNPILELVLRRLWV